MTRTKKHVRPSSNVSHRSRLFHKRNIIIVSADGVKHYPLSATLQMVGLAAIMGLLSWGSYSTGSYFTANSIMTAQERKIQTTTRVNHQIEAQYALLRQDLEKLHDKTGDLNEYERFVVAQHDNIGTIMPKQGNANLDDNNLNKMSNGLMQDRIGYLEGMVEQLQEDRESLVSSIRERTQDQIDTFEDLINSTGMSVSSLSNQKRARMLTEKLEMLDDNDKDAQEDSAEEGDKDHQGGPFIPASPSKMTKEQEEKEDAMLADINRLVVLSDIAGAMPLGRPLQHARVTSGFGGRMDPFHHQSAVHKGMDFDGGNRSQVRSTANGVVVSAGREGAYGYMVEIAHGYGFTTRYAHLGRILVRKGMRITKGTPIGLQGSTGRSTGSHLHYEVRFNGNPINPRKFVEAKHAVF